ncbi:MAG TPA: DUF3618 domain-containing protein [Gemmatimonadales bacterium]|nr:DUF3618 domain-containing protein [Gemmatimonadales bacterium]
MNPDRWESGNGGIAEENRSPQEIEYDIERTRERLSQHIDELEERLNPRNLKRQARDALAAKVQDAAANAGQRARQARSRVADLASERPWAAAAAGAGVLLLLALRIRARRRTRRARASRAARRLRRAM